MVTVKTKLLGLIGNPISHSISPELHNHILNKYGMDYVYLGLPIKPNQLEKGVSGLKALGIKGVNVTIPYKKKVISYLDEIEEWAQKIGAVNTIVNREGKLVGYNTDGIGFKKMMSVDNGVSLSDKKVLIVGAGGAARSVAAVFCESGVKEIMIANRTRENADQLVDKYNRLYPSKKVFLKSFSLNELSRSDMIGVDIVVNATPVGMSPDTDVETVLLKEAKKRGATVINGLGMLLHQASESFRIWTDYRPNIEDYQVFLNNKDLF